MNIYIIIPGFNEEKYLNRVLKKTIEVTKNVIYVDDGSTDKSLKIAQGYVKHTLHHEINLGKGSALKTGCEYAFYKLNADAVIFMDSDDQHDPQDYYRFSKLLQTGALVIFGVRKFSGNMPLIRFLGNKFASVFLNILFDAYIPDIPSGYKAISRKVYNKLKWKSKGYEVETEIAARVAKNKIPFKTLDIEAIYHDTDKGMTILDALVIMKFLIKLRFINKV